MDQQVHSRPERILFWQGHPSDHSGAYHVILTVGYDGKPIRTVAENPDSIRLEIPGLLDSGWDFDPPHILSLFFAQAKTVRPMTGVYLNEKKIGSKDELSAELTGLDSLYRKLLEPLAQVPSPDSEQHCYRYSDLIAIYLRVGAEAMSVGCSEEDIETRIDIREALAKVNALLDQQEEGFAQIVAAENGSNIEVTELADIMSLWLWGETPVRNINMGESC